MYGEGDYMSTSDAQLKAIKKYLNSQDEIKLRIPKGKRDEIKKYAIEKGYGGIQPYLKALIEKDSGIEL